MTRFSFVLLIVTACISMFAVVGFAQNQAANGGTIQGQITDLTPNENPIEGVEVKIVAQNSGKEFITKTDVDGNYKHAGLPPGRYLISISKEEYNERTGQPVTVIDSGKHFVPLKMIRKGDVEPFFEVRRDERMNVVIKQRIVSLIQRVAEGVGKRYALDETVINAFHQSFLNSIGSTLKQEDGLSVFARAVEQGNMSLLEMLLAHPGCKAAFAKHLSEGQIQDYLEFTEAREVRDQQAVVQWIIVALDKELSLRADQREKFVQSLLDTAKSGFFPNAMNALWLSPQQAAQLAHYRLKVSLEGVLSETQSKVWQGLVNANTNIERVFVVDPEAKLTAHTELLGSLDERATRRLALVTKGVAQEQIEARDEAREAILQESEKQLMKAVEAGVMTRKQAAVRLQAMLKDLQDEDRINNRRGETSASDITRDGLYQQTIKDVLSAEAFARYSAHQTQREALRHQALRNIAVACMDTQMLLDDTQREQLETAVLQLAPVPYSGSKPAVFMFFQMFRREKNFEMLTPWQQGEFERVFAPIM